MFNPPPHIPPRYIYIYGIHVCVSGGGSEWGGGVLLCVTICTCVCVLCRLPCVSVYYVRFGRVRGKCLYKRRLLTVV